MGNLCKITSMMLFGLDIVGSIFLGITFHSLFFFYSIVVGFVFCVLLYSIGELIEQIDLLNSRTQNLYEELNRVSLNNNSNENSKNSSEDQTEEPTFLGISAFDETWICPKCKTKNKSLYCKNCFSPKSHE